MNSTIIIPSPQSFRETTDVESKSSYNVSIGQLRAFVTALVVAHHAVLAYHPWAPPPPASLSTQPRFWEAFPVVDAQRWTGWALFVGWNDSFFMALMFLLSGLFVWSSLQRKGSGGFLSGRLVRLGLPFIFAAAFLAPLAYFPAYLKSSSQHTLDGFWAQWSKLGTWPAGPAWFIWVLLAFGCAAVALSKLAPHWAESLNAVSSNLLRRPIAFFGALVLLSALAYVPMAVSFGALNWKAWGPFTFQTSRIFLYATYFAAGIILGANPTEATLLSSNGPLAKRWILWPATAFVAFVAATIVTIVALSNPAALRSLGWLINLCFPITCAATCFALLSLFLRFARSQGPLRENFCTAAYGIYLVHYPIVNWTQYALLPLNLSAILKGIIVTAVGLALSWALIALARSSRLIARII
jgi:peptidoglycan/LPS O-acetylase OafA/YrhL